MFSFRIVVAVSALLLATSCRYVLSLDEFEGEGPADARQDARQDVDAATSDGPMAIDAALEPRPIQIGAGRNHTCALISNGEVWCWGDHAWGQLGISHPPGGYRTTPTLVPGLNDVVELAVAREHVCVRHADNTVSCWGHNATGALGNGNFGDQGRPVSVSLPPVAQVATTEEFTCARLVDGSAWCWGNNSSGQLGNGSATGTVATPVEVNLGGVAIDDIAPGLNHTCASRSDGGTALCWGSNQVSQLGNAGGSSPNPVAASISGELDLWAGDYHTCALLGNGQVHCWGDGAAARLGRDISPDFHTPVPGPVDGLSAVTSGMSQDHSCVVEKQTAYCWGRNEFEQLGPNSIGLGTSITPLEVPIEGVTGTVLEVATGLAHSCAIRTDGTVWCWGDNLRGKLGNGDVTASATPVMAAF